MNIYKIHLPLKKYSNLFDTICEISKTISQNNIIIENIKIDYHCIYISKENGTSRPITKIVLTILTNNVNNLYFALEKYISYLEEIENCYFEKLKKQDIIYNYNIQIVKENI